MECERGEKNQNFNLLDDLWFWQSTFCAHKAEQQVEYLKYNITLFIYLSYKAIYTQIQFKQGTEKVIYFSDLIFNINLHIKFYFPWILYSFAYC